MGLELEYFLVKQRDDGSIEIADPYDTLEKPCYDMAGLTRRYDFLTTVSRYCNDLGWGNYANDHEDANGQFEQNFTYDDALVALRPRDLLPLHGSHARGAERDDRDLHAEAVHQLTGNGCHFHMSLWDGETNLFLDESDPRGLGLSETAYNFIGGLKTHARAHERAHRPDGELVQAPQGRHDDERRDLVAGLDLVRLQQPHADAPHPRAGPRSRTARSTARATRTSRPRRCSRPGSTGSRRASTPASRTRRTSTRSRTTSYAARGLETLPANLLEATRRARSGRGAACGFGRGRDEDYVDYFIRVKLDEWNRYHEQVTPWEIREYLTRF